MHDLQRYLVDEFVEEYEAGSLGRADLERRVIGMLGAAEAATVLAGLPVLTHATRPRVAVPRPMAGGAGLLTRDDVRIPIEGGGTLECYLARPDGEERYPTIVAIHENRGLVEHIKDVARRLAGEGYLVLAPDLLSRQGGTAQFADSADAIAALGKSDPEQNTRDLVAAIDYLKTRPHVEAERIGVTGWCMGGGYTWRTAVAAGNRIKAAVPWYGPNPPAGAENIAAPVFAIYGALDERINAGIPAMTEKMQELGKPFEKKIYPNAQHAFNNDTNAERYNAEQAPIAWNDMLQFFGKHLKG